MRRIAVASLLALTLLSTATTLPTLGQTTALDRNPARYAGADFSMACKSITQKDWVVWCDGIGFNVEFRMWDAQNPARVTLIKAGTVRYDLSTGEVRPERNVSLTIENVPNKQTLSNKTLTLPPVRGNR